MKGLKSDVVVLVIASIKRNPFTIVLFSQTGLIFTNKNSAPEESKISFSFSLKFDIFNVHIGCIVFIR